MIRFKRLAKSFVYASRGLLKAFKSEQNLQIESLIALVVIIFGFIFKITVNEWLIIILVIGLVIVTELVNSAVELTSDALKPRLDQYVKEIKDIMAAAVVVASLVSIIIAIIIFLPKIFYFLINNFK